MPHKATERAKRLTAKAKPAAKAKPKTTKTEAAKPKTSKAAKPKKAVKTIAVEAPPTEQISVRAYEIWLRKGQPYGRDEENWLEAEAELRVKA